MVFSVKLDKWLDPEATEISGKIVLTLPGFRLNPQRLGIFGGQIFLHGLLKSILLDRYPT